MNHVWVLEASSYLHTHHLCLQQKEALWTHQPRCTAHKHKDTPHPMHQNGLRSLSALKTWVSRVLLSSLKSTPLSYQVFYFTLNERIGMFQQEFFAYILDTKKAISLKAYVSIPIRKVFILTNINLWPNLYIFRDARRSKCWVYHT